MGSGAAWPRPQIEVETIASSHSSTCSRGIAASPPASSSSTWWIPRVPMRHGVHFWHDSSAKKRIVSASSLSGEYVAGNTWSAAEPGDAPHSPSASRVSGTSSAAGGRIPLAAPPGTIAPMSCVAPPAWSSISCRAVTSSGAS